MHGRARLPGVRTDLEDEAAIHHEVANPIRSIATAGRDPDCALDHDEPDLDSVRSTRGATSRCEVRKLLLLECFVNQG